MRMISYTRMYYISYTRMYFGHFFYCDIRRHSSSYSTNTLELSLNILALRSMINPICVQCIVPFPPV